MNATSAKRVFDAVLQSGHKQHACEVPFDPAEIWKTAAAPLWHGRRGHRVRATCNGLAFDSAIVARSRRFWLLVEDDVRARAGWEAGEPLRVELVPAG
ncbi:MAG: DUF1905 domain-containing protein [Luteimonas sp.]